MGALWPPAQIPADMVSDLATEGNALSVWEIEDNRTNLDRIIAAVAGGRANPAEFGLAIFNSAALDTSGIRFRKTRGTSPDAEANDRWHYELIELTGQNLIALARVIAAVDSKERRLPREVIQLVAQGIRAGQIDENTLKTGMRNAVRQPLV